MRTIEKVRALKRQKQELQKKIGKSSRQDERDATKGELARVIEELVKLTGLPADMVRGN